MTRMLIAQCVHGLCVVSVPLKVSWLKDGSSNNLPVLVWNRNNTPTNLLFKVVVSLEQWNNWDIQ